MNSKLKKIYGVRYLLAKTQNLYYIYIIFAFADGLKCSLSIIWKPILQSIYTFFLFYIFYIYNILLISEEFLQYRLYLFLILLLLIFIVFIIYWWPSLKQEIGIIEGKKKWKIIIKKVIIILVNMGINIVIILKIFDISLIELMQYTLLLQLYKLYGLFVFLFNKLLNKNYKYYNINSFIYYPYIYLIILILLIKLKWNFTIMFVTIVDFISNFYLNYSGVMVLKFYKGDLIRRGEKVIIKWK